MRHLKIAIVTYNWPPRNAIGTHRPYSWAKYWSAMGAEVFVLTSCKYEFDQPLDLNFPPLDGVTVYEVPYLGASKITLFLLRLPRIRSFLKRIKGLLSKSYNTGFDVREGWRPASKKTALELAGKVDVVVSTFGPAASHLIAYDMKMANEKLFWVADYRDLWSENYASQLEEKKRTDIRQLELSTVGALADRVTTVSEGLAYQLEPFLQKEIHIVPNGFDFSKGQTLLRKHPRLQGGPLKIVYTGMIYPQFQDPSILFEAIEGLIESNIFQANDIEVDFYGSCADFIKAAGYHRRYSFLSIKGHVSRERALAAQSEADILLILDSIDYKKKGILTGKIFEYIASGTPIINLGGEQDSAIANIIQETGTGVSVGKNINRVVDVLVEISDTNSKLEWFSPKPEAILVYSRQKIALKMYNEILRELGET